MSNQILAPEVTPPSVTLQGTSGSECEAFVVAIQEYAFATGQDDDPHWMMRFARTRLRGKALRWYATLETSVKGDWDRFVQALFEQYPLDEQPDGADIRTPACSNGSGTVLPGGSEIYPYRGSADRTLPPQDPRPISLNSRGTCSTNETPISARRYDISMSGQQIGLLRIVTVDGTTPPQYVSRGYTLEDELIYSDKSGCWYSCRQRTTLDRHEALVVSFLPSSEPHTMACLNSNRHSRGIAIWYCNDADSDFSKYYSIWGCTRQHPISTAKSSGGTFDSKVWNVLEDGTLQASLSAFSRSAPHEPYVETQFTTTEVHPDISGDLSFVKPGAELR